MPPAAQPKKLSPAEQKAADLRLPRLDRSALNPEKRAPVQVLEGERNPFGLVKLQPGEKAPVAVVKTESEEAKLRRVLANMRVTGLSGYPGSYRVMIGSMPLREGEIVPKMFADQAEKLLVQSVSDRQVILAFVEKDKSVKPRRIELNVDLRPNVKSLLPGEVFVKQVPFDGNGSPDLPPLQNAAAMGVLQAGEEQNSESLVERQYELLNAPARLKSDETKEE